MNLQKWRDEVCRSRSKNKGWLLSFIDEEIRQETLTANQKRAESMEGYWRDVRLHAALRNETVRQELDRRALEELKALSKKLRRTINERKRDAKDYGRANGAC